MSLIFSYISGAITLAISWFLMKDLFFPVVVVFISSSIYLYVSGPNPIAFALCLCNGWILLNLVIESVFPIYDSVK
jgi:hypothetical protein